jgi:hypothetical protein
VVGVDVEGLAAGLLLAAPCGFKSMEKRNMELVVKRPLNNSLVLTNIL